METKLVISGKSIEKIELISYDPLKEKEDELKQIEQMEHDMLILNQIMKEFGCAVQTQGINLEHVNTEVVESLKDVDNANIEIKESLGIKTKIITMKLGIATAVVVGINAPIGLMLGTKILIGTLLASGALTAMWVSKNN